MKDGYIRFLLPAELKAQFAAACDGRPMTAVLIRLMEQYVKEEANNAERGLSNQKQDN